ncbi:MAG: efflux RND transporter periplasmic adaptor subunit [Alphaproteobacteria bacterium]|nr:efflux RND transporter periplasmic adaptor subunit [Alphaproteobacteria bacterium]
MDGDLNTIHTEGGTIVARDGTPLRPAARQPRTVRWFLIVGLLLVLVLGLLYGYNAFREHMTASFFASNKPPPAQITAVKAVTEAVPHFATAIGSLAAVHQVTVTPEVGGRVTALNFTAGTHVNAGDALVQLNDAPDRGDLANYQAQSRLAAVSLRRAQLMAQHQFGTVESVDQTQSQFDQANAQIAKTQAIIAQKLIRAPFSGQLGVRQIDLGQYVQPGAPIVSLTDLRQLYVNFTLPSTQRADISVGQKVNVTLDAFPGRSFEAQISTIDPQVRADSRTMTVQATLPNPDETLLPGMFVNAAVVLPEEPDRVVLPETAVDYTLYGDSVFVIREDGKDASGKPILTAHRVPVKTGMRWNGNVAIRDGVTAGTMVAAAGQVKLQDGSAVAVTDSAPPKPPTKPTMN